MLMEPMLRSYSGNCTLQESCQVIGNPILERMAALYEEGRRLDDMTIVRIAEYGCAGGENSYQPMSAIISTLRSKHPNLGVECVLEDLPSYQWYQVMQEAERLAWACGGGVHTLCAGTSFYNQICSTESVDLAYSYVAAHFLSETLPLTTHVMMHESAPAETAAWHAQAAKDWENFLLLRARELKKGGKMMISTMSRDSLGYSWQKFSHVVWSGIQRAHTKGILSRREVETLCIPACLRSEEEIMAPFATTSEVGSSLSVDLLEFSRTEIVKERGLPNSVLAPIIRRRVESVWGGMFLRQLNQLGRNEASCRDAMGELWDDFEAEILKDPSAGWVDMQSFFLQVTKN